MALAFASSFHLATGRVKPLTSSNATRKLYSQMKVSGSATVAVDRTQVSEFELENKKHDLLSTIQGTQRGQNTNADQRSIIEEALVGLEGCNMGEPIDLVKLDGTWRLQYTSAPDVLVLFEAAARLPFFKVGQIFQKFECRDKSDGGVICNVVRWSVPPLLEKEEGATLVVSAKFDVVSVRNIYLQFEEVTVQNIYISEELQALIAPAILPRSFLSLQESFIMNAYVQILQFIRAFKAQIPVTNTTPGRRSVGGLYYLSYLDNNMLLGRAVGGGGVFVFTKAQPLEL
ncbi:putative plastid-lipid-associated protein 10 [Citrus sinensis]|nr:putative plastid-lipid-associated protein 10 [Citrus sinensis]